MKKIIQLFKAIKIYFQLGPEKVIRLQEQNAELQKRNAELQEQANRDPLTNLLNRRYLEEWGRNELARTVRYGHPLSLIEIDIDDLKRVNDEEGHLVGDKILKKVANLLERVCRESDLSFRIGGDEFLVVLPETKEEGAKKVAERLKELAKKELFSPGGQPIELSSGVASWQEKLSFEALRAEADAELYQEKGSKLKV